MGNIFIVQFSLSFKSHRESCTIFIFCDRTEYHRNREPNEPPRSATSLTLSHSFSSFDSPAPSQHFQEPPSLILEDEQSAEFDEDTPSDIGTTETLNDEEEIDLDIEEGFGTFNIDEEDCGLCFSRCL